MISKKGLYQQILRHEDAREAALRWFQIASSADWASLEDVRQAFLSVGLRLLLVLDFRGIRYRLIVRINFRARKLFVKELLSHAEYDKGNWKQWDN